MCKKQKSISTLKMKSSHSHCKRLYCTAEGFNVQQTALMHSKQPYCIAEGFNARYKALLHSKRFYCTARHFTAQQKSQSCSRNWRKVPSAAETEDKPTLQHLPLDLDSTFVHKMVAAKWYFETHYAERSAQLPSQKRNVKRTLYKGIYVPKLDKFD